VEIMLIPTVKAKEFEKFGFKKCKGEYGKHGCYYLCVSRGIKMLFVSDVYFDVINWKDDDPRIHKNANCRYRDRRTYLDIIYELIKANMLTSGYAKYELRQKQYVKGFESDYNKAIDDAYDVDKVVEQLREQQEKLETDIFARESDNWYGQYCNGIHEGIDKAIEIVKAGGVE
jgi:hypothetical protein